MSEKPSSRRKFLQLLGLSAGATLIPNSTMAGFVDNTEILKLTAEQQVFMLRYEKWMEEFIEVIRIQKTNPGDVKNNADMIALTHRAEEMKPELTDFMKDETFSKIYQVSIKRMTDEI